MIVGIAADETRRIDRKTVDGKTLPLVDLGITEAMAFDIAKKEGLLSPAYNGDRTRLGCWFCHNQRISELRRLRSEYPELWGKLLAIDGDSPVTFKAGSKTKPGATIRSLDKRFFDETAQITFFEYLKELEDEEENHDGKRTAERNP